MDRLSFLQLLWALLLCASPWVASQPAHADGADPVSAELAARRQAFAGSRGAERVFPVLDVAALDELSLDGGAAAMSFLREVIAHVDDPLIAAQARWELSGMLERRGDRAGAANVRAPLGLLDVGLWFAGPFPVERGAELAPDESLPPESVLLSGPLSPRSQGAVTRGGGPTAVRELPVGNTAGILPLGALLRPDVHVAAYVIVTLRSPRATEAAVRIGSTGAVAVWVNGRGVGGRRGDRPLALDADAYGVRLRAGLNRLVVRVATDERRPELIVRVTDPKGAALAGLELVPNARDPIVVASGVVRRAIRTLQSAMAPPQGDAFVILQGIAGARPETVCDRALARVDAYRPARAFALQLRCARDADGRRRVLEDRVHLLERAPTSGEPYELDAARLQLAEQVLRGRTPQQAEALLAAAARGDELRTWRARLRLAEVASDRGLLSLAEQKLDELFRMAPARRVREALAQLEHRRGVRKAALEHYRALVAEWPGETSARRQLASFLRAGATAPDLEAALAALDYAVPLRDLELVLSDRADLSEGKGDPVAAASSLRAALALAPDDPRVEERLGRLLLAEGERTEGLAHLETALRLRPQNPELRGVLSDLAQGGKGELARRFAVDVAELRRRAEHELLGRGDPSRVLYDGVTVRVHANGLEESFTERVVEIGDRRGAEHEGTASIRFAPDSQTVEVRTARVYKKNGDVVEAASIDEQDLSEPWAGLFYDVRAQVVSLPALEPGDVVHVAYTVADHGRRNEMGESYAGIYMLAEKQVRLDSRYRLIAPRERALYFNQPKVGGVAIAPTVTEEGDERRYEFAARGVSKLASEPGMPGDTAGGAYVHASTFADWGEVARFYRGLMRTQLEPDASIRAAARAAVGGRTRIEDKVAAIYDLVVRSTRYVGLEFGIHGYQPYSVTQVWTRRFGDCKDKASLLVAMLKEVGVAATLVLLRTRHEGGVAPEPASLAPFDHAIAYVPALDRYLDGTAEFSGSTELPGEDQGAMVLHVDDGQLLTSPVRGPDASVSDAVLDVKVAVDGSARLIEKKTVSGQFAEGWRRQYQAVAQRKERYAKVWGERSPGAEVEMVDLPTLADRERAVQVSAAIHLPRLAHADGDGGISIPVLAREPWLLAAFAKLSERKEDLELPSAFTERERVRYALPPSSGVRAPPDVELRSPFGHFSLHVKVTKQGAEVVAETVLATRRIGTKDYLAFRAFLSEVDRALAAHLRVELPR